MSCYISLYIRTDCNRGSRLVDSAVLQIICLKRLLLDGNAPFVMVSRSAPIDDPIPPEARSTARVTRREALDHARDMVDFLEVATFGDGNSAGRVQNSVVTRLC